MTAAQIRAAAALVEEHDLANDAIVSLTEIGSEGAVFQVGTWMERGDRVLISRDGSFQVWA